MQEDIEKSLCFLDICIWISCGKFSLLPREYLSSGPNVLRDSP